MLAYYVEWHLRRKLAPLLFEDAEREAAARRKTAVEPEQGLRTLLAHLGTLSLHRVALTQDNPHEFDLLTGQTPLQKQAFALLGVEPEKIVSSKLTGRNRGTRFD